MKTKLLLTIALCTIFGCAIAHADQNKITKKKTSISQNANARIFQTQPSRHLTGSYSEDMQMALPRSSCLAIDPNNYSYEGGSKAVISLDKSESFDKLQQDLNVSVSISGNYDMFSGSMGADYARQVEQDAYSEGFYYYEKIQLPTKIYSPSTIGTASLDSFGKSVELADATGQLFRQYCGNKYIAETPMGANLFVTLKLDFSSASEKTTFDAHASAGLGSFGSATGNLQSIVNQYHLQGSLDIYAMQEGGDASQLANIFGAKSCNGHYCVTTCNLQHLDDCSGVIDNVITYAQKKFPDQVDYKDGQVSKLASPVSYIYSDYPPLVKVGTSVITKPISDARIWLGDLYKQTKQNYNLIHHLLSSQYAPYIDKKDYEVLQKIDQKLKDNLSVLNDPINGAIRCYQDPVSCDVTVIPNIQNRLKKLDANEQAVFDKFNTAYETVDGGGQNTVCDSCGWGSIYYVFFIWNKTKLSGYYRYSKTNTRAYRIYGVIRTL